MENLEVASYRRKGQRELIGASLLLIILSAIWVLGNRYWDERYYVADEGLGYWMGIVGGILMLFAMTYSYIKRKLVSRSPSMLKPWFLLHLFAGIIGPVIILFHTTFELGSVNGTVAFLATVAVFVSGLTGRFILSGLNRTSDEDEMQSIKKLMSYWRVIHIPLLYILFFTGVVHVLAVHLY